MRAIYIYNKISGKGKALKKKEYIVKELNKIFNELDVVESTSKEHFIKTCQNACSNYDSLIFAGGDGTFNMVANAIVNYEHRPILGVIPTGTINDAAKNFGLNRNIKKSIKTIKKGVVRTFDLGKINDKYFVFTAAIGAYADIPLITKNNRKKDVGPLAYYFKAIPELFKSYKVHGELKLESGEKIEYVTPFILIMNSSHIGGFKINPKSNISDGKVDLLFTKPSLFNSLLKYLFRINVKHYQVSSCKLTLDSKDHWDIDGEEGPLGNVSISVLPNHLSIYTRK